eukprot:scaffold614_cov163-Amphora_coffeaeformis.AAC.8
MEENEQERSVVEAVVPALADFSQLVGTLLMQIEELRSHVKQAATETTLIHAEQQVCTWQQDLEDLLPLLDTLSRRTADVADPDSIEAAMFQSCQTKAIQLAQLIFHTVMDKYQEPKEAMTDESEHGDHSLTAEAEQQREAWIQQAQGSIARLAELNFILVVAGANNNSQASVQKDLDDTIQRYVKYQRSVFRLRAKPPIARLVEYRKEQSKIHNNNTRGGLLLDGKVKIHHDDADSDDEDEEKAVYEQHHAPVLTHILGQAAALIHPLLVWKSQLPPAPCENLVVESIRKLCQETIQVLDEQTQVLAKSVSDWFWQDHPIEEYLSQSAEVDDPNNAKSIMNGAQLGALDGLVEEMRFSCHAQAHYVALVAYSGEDEPITDGSTPTPLLAQTLEKELLPEWTWKYASLERFLAVRQWQSALAVCQPVQIVIGMPIQVPSVVEDAQFLSTRALERSATTRSAQAMGTVAHAVSHDIWSTDTGVVGSVYQALVEQRGCWSAPTKESEATDGLNSSSSKQKLDFASALMDALDDDMVQAAVAKKPGTVSSPGRLPSAPSSGGFLGLALGDNQAVLQMQIDVRFCVMNGAHASAAACRALVEYLDSLLKSDDGLDTRGGRSTSMIELAREELFRYAGDYEKFLKVQIHSSITEFAGGKRAPRSRLVLDRIYEFFANENYAIDVKEIKKLEDDDRLARELDSRFHSSMFLNQISQKGESHVIHLIGEELEEALTQIVTDALFVPERRVTDWGALLFWKEIRRLQGLVTQALTSDHADEPPVFAWARLSQIATVLQLESPSEWLIYRSSASVLTKEELEQTMSLRSDFSVDAIRTVLASMNQ